MMRWPAVILAVLLVGCASTPSTNATGAPRPASSTSGHVPSASAGTSTPGPGKGMTGLIAYVAGADPQIHLLDLMTGESRQLTHLTERDAAPISQGPMRPAMSCFFGPSSLSWSPDGSLLSFAYGGCESVVHVVDLEGRLTRIADGRSPSWSPDGGRLLFSPNVAFCPMPDPTACGEPPQQDAWNLQIVDIAAGTPPRPLSADQATAFGAQATYSPDGALIAYSGRLPNPEQDPELFGATWVIDADGSNARVIARGAWPVGWLADRRLALVDERSGAIHAVELSTGEAVALSRTSGPVSLSPTGGHVMTTETDNATGVSTTVIVATADGSIVASVRAHPWGWAPSGSAAAVINLESGVALVIGLDGTEIVRHRLPDAMNAFTAAWRPGS